MGGGAPSLAGVALAAASQPASHAAPSAAAAWRAASSAPATLAPPPATLAPPPATLAPPPGACVGACVGTGAAASPAEDAPASEGELLRNAPSEGFDSDRG